VHRAFDEKGKGEMQSVGNAAMGLARDRGLPMTSEAVREAAISDLVGCLVGEYLGHESKARTYLNEDVITVILEDTLTKGEERLVRDGMTELVLRMRGAFQQTLREDLISRVEGLTGRKVRVSANQMTSDLTVEVLVLDGASVGPAVYGER
jgi:uncharacterized protein YbcI